MPRTKPTAAGRDPRSGRGLPRDRVRRGDVGVGAVIDVEHRALRALEQDAPAVCGGPRRAGATPARHRAGCAARSRAARRSARRDRSPARRARAAAHCGAAAARRPALRAPAGRRGRRPGAPGARPCPHRPDRCRGRSCRSCLSPRRSSRARSSAPCDGRISAALSASFRFCGLTSTPFARIASISSSSAHGSTTTPLPMIDSLPGRTTPDGSRLSLYSTLPMTSVWPALCPP